MNCTHLRPEADYLNIAWHYSRVIHTRRQHRMGREGKVVKSGHGEKMFLTLTTDTTSHCTKTVSEKNSTGLRVGGVIGSRCMIVRFT